MNYHIIVLAAGEGTRMQTNLPKVLQPLAGKSLIDHVLNTAAQISKKISVVVGYEKELLIDHLSLNHNTVMTVFQAKQIGTADAVKTGMPNSNQDDMVLVLYGDVPLIQASTILDGVDDQHDAFIFTMELNDPTGYGRVIKNADGFATCIIEEKDASDPEKKINEVFTGILVMRSSTLNDLLALVDNKNAAGEYYLTDVIKIGYEKNVKIKPISIDPNEVVGANTKAELEQLETIYRDMKAKDLLEMGITLSDVSRVDVRGEVSAGKDCSIDINAILEGRVTLGNNVSIGPNVLLKNVEIGDNSKIEAFSHIVSTSIGSNCNIGPYARLREGTTIKNDARVGNFVETKKTTLGQGSKASHLAYLGDADIGEETNIGAGTITCNYDGKNKNSTKVGKKSFIGTNSSLVAPIEIGDNAYVGAGSVITKNVEDDALAIARGKQVNKPGWSKSKK